ncbi:carbon storage regulator [Candidatus Contubernalis alkaliaceticus]|uniref:carbon storage regulator n=1 Tax=Candidatus Contubernalis alkaliaceticus TaxID=338645 RepID=UPI001F4BD2F6|nr:carbon storage regulator [Candidatus Contubernalis alkalaceticus]UNC91736.1 carbon storage regulator [Candidatus Contubernalis alkalaceticus]
MLVIGRKPGQYIVINNSITIKVVKTDKGEIRLAVNAPEDIKVLRGEIYTKTASD